jgi:RNA polymerase sigma-70 factor (ECF subfamily)
MASRLQTEVSSGDESLVDEQQLVESCRLGDHEAQRHLYEQHCDKVYRLMYRIAGSSNAEDLTQQVFLCVFKKLSQFQCRSSFATWLYRLATNEALQFLRRQQRERCLSVPHGVIDHFNGSSCLDQQDLLEFALNQLDPDLRAVLLLREVEDLSYYDIAMTLDIAEGTVASRLNRARRCLREIVGDAIA